MRKRSSYAVARGTMPPAVDLTFVVLPSTVARDPNQLGAGASDRSATLGQAILGCPTDHLTPAQ